MPIRLHNVRAGLDADLDALRVTAAEKLGLRPDQIESVRVVRRAIDARHQRPAFVYTLDATLSANEDPEAVAERTAATLVAEPAAPRLELRPGTTPLPERPVVVGAGPAGLFAALLLAEHGFRPLVLERGRSVEQRTADIDTFLDGGPLDPESNLLFGLGGAGAWSDGKLVWAASDPLAAWVLHTLVRCGAPQDILVDARPHVGTDRLRDVVTRLAERIEAAGAEFRFGCRVDALALDGDRAAGVRCGNVTIPAGPILLATGHSARDTVRSLAEQDVALEPRPFQVGVRIEHPQRMIDRNQYGKYADHPALPPAIYTLRHKARDPLRSVHSFCMCPGGAVVPATHRHGHLCTNGMSRHARDGAFANAALVVPVNPKDFGSGPLDGLLFQEHIEQAAFQATGSFRAPAQRADDFVQDRDGPPPQRTSYPLGVVPARFSRLLPRVVYASIARALQVTFDRRIPGYAGEHGTVLGPETRVTSPVRLLRDPASRESVSTPGLFPVGEGSGYAGGIVASALDGLQTARALIKRYAPPAN
jgi:hypothetical protein